MPDIDNIQLLLNSDVKLSLSEGYNRHLSRSRDQSLLSPNRSQPILVVVVGTSCAPGLIMEFRSLKIPTIGLAGPDEVSLVDYPVLGNNQSIHTVHFFCHFLAVLIAKEISGCDDSKKRQV
jgi:ribosomal protein S2